MTTQMGEIARVHERVTDITVKQILSEVTLLEDPTAQFIALDVYSPITASRLPSPIRMTKDDVEALLDFSCNPASSPSTLVRAQALEVAVCAVEGSEFNRNGAIRDVYGLRKLRPDNQSERDLAVLLKNPLSSSVSAAYPFKYREAVKKLAVKEGIQVGAVLPDWSELEWGSSEFDEPVPTAALLLLAYLAKIQETPHKMPLDEMSRFVPLALDMQSALQEDQEFVTTKNELALRADAHKIIELLNTDTAESQAYQEQHLALYLATMDVQKLFPSAYELGVRRGGQSLAASAMYAMQSHTNNGGYSKVELPLNGDAQRTLPFEMHADELIVILRSLSNSMMKLRKVVEAEDLATTLVNGTDGYKLYRLWSGGAINAASVYIRPHGSASFDPNLEYGRNGQGVEASISYVVDDSLREGQLIELGKHRGSKPDNRISIRLDREGVAPELRGKGTVQHDPLQQAGTLSLDIGSVLGEKGWTSTKVGRLLAWGNLLRSEIIGENTQLNHVTRYFDKSAGDATVFAGNAHELIERFESKRVTKKELRARLGSSPSGRK